MSVKVEENKVVITKDMTASNSKTPSAAAKNSLLINEREKDVEPKAIKNKSTSTSNSTAMMTTKIKFPYMRCGSLDLEMPPNMDSTSTTTNSSSKSMLPLIEIPDENDKRFSVLSFEQVKRLNDLMNNVITIHGRGNFPTIDVKLCDLVSKVRTKLEADYNIPVKEIRLNGSGASSVLAADIISYNDLDLIFSVDLPNNRAYDRVKMAVLDSLMELLPEGVSRKRMSSCSMKEAYVSKMVKVIDSDRWSLITLGNNRSKTVELKFVDSMRRQYEFSVDSFHIMLDALLFFYKYAPSMEISDNFYPTVFGESKYNDFEEALLHLHKKLIATKNPEEIRGGGLLKYCNLLVRRYRPAWPEEVKSMERYMCSRFFIDFPDINQQRAKLENYLWNHFQSDEDPQLKYDYMMILYQVVDESTVCLMNHERRLTLSLIEDLAMQVYNCGAYADNSDAVSTASSASSSSCSISRSPLPLHSMHIPPPVTTVTTITTQPPPLSHQQQQQHHQPHQQQPQQQQQQPPQPHQTGGGIPTYEIVTTCQPAVFYSHNGYYFMSSTAAPPPPQVTPATTTTAAAAAARGACLTCSCNQWATMQAASQQQQQQQQQNQVCS